MKRALLVIDVQNDYFSGFHAITHPPGSYAKILSAMAAAHAAGMPIALIQHSSLQADAPVFRKGSPGWEVAPEVLAHPHDTVIEKLLPGSFTGTPLEAWLRGRGIDTVVIAGYMTQMCCDTTARQALHLGFAVEFLGDATGTHDFSNDAGAVRAEELHRATLVTMAMRFARVLSVEEWLGKIGE